MTSEELELLEAVAESNAALGALEELAKSKNAPLVAALALKALAHLELDESKAKLNSPSPS